MSANLDQHIHSALSSFEKQSTALSRVCFTYSSPATMASNSFKDGAEQLSSQLYKVCSSPLEPQPGNPSYSIRNPSTLTPTAEYHCRHLSRRKSLRSAHQRPTLQIPKPLPLPPPQLKRIFRRTSQESPSPSGPCTWQITRKLQHHGLHPPRTNPDLGALDHHGWASRA